MTESYAHGKLLLSGEYAVLRGATALALPSVYGQKMRIETVDSSAQIHWKALDHRGEPWLRASFELPSMNVLSSESEEIKRLQSLLRTVYELNPGKFDASVGLKIETQLEFPRDWGLGSSSTLISLLSDYFEIDPYQLLDKTMGGSGYDLACAKADGPIFFERKAQEISVAQVDFDPSFSDRMFFVPLNRKQSTAKEITNFKNEALSDEDLSFFSGLARELCRYQNDFTQFSEALEAHEERLSRILKRPTVKSLLFPDYPKTIKSLGAWGGDFVLAMGEEAMDYFPSQGYETTIGYKKIVL